MVCETIIKLNYMEKILLSCPLLYLNGTVTNELLKGEKVIAIVVENTLMSLKNQIRMSYRGAERECENLTFADGHYGYLSLKKEFELWVSHREELNRTVEVLRENGQSRPCSDRNRVSFFPRAKYTSAVSAQLFPLSAHRNPQRY